MATRLYNHAALLQFSYFGPYSDIFQLYLKLYLELLMNHACQFGIIATENLFSLKVEFGKSLLQYPAKKGKLFKRVLFLNYIMDTKKYSK
jgi:hypothetical protein